MAKGAGLVLGLGAAAAIGLLLYSRSGSAATGGAEPLPVVPPNPEPGPVGPGLAPDPNWPAGIGDQIDYIGRIGLAAYDKALIAVKNPSSQEVRNQVAIPAALFQQAATRFEQLSLGRLPAGCSGTSKNAVMAARNAQAVAYQSFGNMKSNTLPTDTANALANAINLWQALGKSFAANCSPVTTAAPKPAIQTPSAALPATRDPACDGLIQWMQDMRGYIDGLADQCAADPSDASCAAHQSFEQQYQAKKSQYEASCAGKVGQ